MSEDKSIITVPLVEEQKDQHTFIRLVSRSTEEEGYTGKLRINRVGDKSSYLQDWFHTLAAFSTPKIIIVIVSAYIISIVLWACIYYLVRFQGFYDINSFVAALFFSTETLTTIGYTVTDITFDILFALFTFLNVFFILQDCSHWLAWVLVTAQAMQGTMMSSFSFGLIYTRLSRGKTRAATILFSDHAILRKINNEWYFMMQVCDRRKHQVLRPSIYMYCIQHSYNERDHMKYQSTYMPLSGPVKDSTPLFIALPVVVSHCITKDSPLYPEHVPEGKEITADDILRHIYEKELEIIVLLDCSEPVTSNDFQARISYIHNEIKPNCYFVPCVGHSKKYKCLCIDLEKFQETKELTEDEMEKSTEHDMNLYLPNTVN